MSKDLLPGLVRVRNFDYRRLLRILSRMWTLVFLVQAWIFMSELIKDGRDWVIVTRG